MACSALLLPFLLVLLSTAPCNSEEVCTSGQCSPAGDAGLALLQSPAAKAQALKKIDVDADVEDHPPSHHDCDPMTYNPSESHRYYSSVYQGDAPGEGHAQSMLDSPAAWSAKEPMPDEYMIMDLGHVSMVKGVITQGRKDKPIEFIMNFTVKYSIDGTSWEDIDGTFMGGKYVDRGNGSLEVDNKLEAVFPEMVEAQFLKLMIKSWASWVSLRAGALVCKSPPKMEACDQKLFNPAESQRSYSTVYQNEAIGTGHAQSMLDSPQAWSAAVAQPNEYMIMDMGEVDKISGLIMQSRADKPWEFVKNFKVMSSSDGSTWQDVGATYLFGETAYRGMIKRWRFKEVVEARYLKVMVMSWHAWVSLRAGVFLCETTATSAPDAA